MPLFRKKPVVVEARQFQPGTGPDLAAWCGGYFVNDALGYAVLIETLEGQMRADPGDWIIRGVKGEFYPCKPDVFAETYETAE